MYNEPEYIIHRNKKVPGWWGDYLPEEKNPYQAADTLTLEKGYLSNYWHIYSSNKHPNYKGAEACNYVHDMIYKRFGGAFLTSQYCGGARIFFPYATDAESERMQREAEERKAKGVVRN